MSRETIAYIIREKKMGFDIPQDLALEMADAILAAWPRSSEIERLRQALGTIAGKNDLSGVEDSEIESAARNALYECELIARAALTNGES